MSELEHLLKVTRHTIKIYLMTGQTFKFTYKGSCRRDQIIDFINDKTEQDYDYSIYEHGEEEQTTDYRKDLFCLPFVNRQVKYEVGGYCQVGPRFDMVIVRKVTSCFVTFERFGLNHGIYKRKIFRDTPHTETTYAGAHLVAANRLRFD
jgi:hypothetical protein